MTTLLPPLPGFGMRGMSGAYGPHRVTVLDISFNHDTGLPNFVQVATVSQGTTANMGLNSTLLSGFAFDLSDPFTFHGFRLWLGFVFGMPLDRAVTPVDWFASPRGFDKWCNDTIAKVLDGPLRLEDHEYLNALSVLLGSWSQMDRFFATEPMGMDRLPRLLVLRPSQWELVWKRNPKHLERAIYLAAVDRP